MNTNTLAARRLASSTLHSQHIESVHCTYLLVDTDVTEGARVSRLTLAQAALARPMPTAWNLWKHKHTHTQLKTHTYTRTHCRPSCVAQMVTHTLHRHYVRTCVRMYVHAHCTNAYQLYTVCTLMLRRTYICTYPPTHTYTDTSTHSLISSLTLIHIRIAFTDFSGVRFARRRGGTLTNTATLTSALSCKNAIDTHAYSTYTASNACCFA